jgi:hypothetical protein
MRPTVSINPQAEPIHRGQALTFSATSIDLDGDAIVLKWALQDATCPANVFDESTWAQPATWQQETSMNVAASDDAAIFCVLVKAIDSHGASSTDGRQYAREDTAPNPVITLVAPLEATSFPFKTQFQLSGSTSTDSAASDMTKSTTFTWSVSSPDVTLDLTSCTVGTSCSFTADAAGEYDVTLTVSDGAETSSVRRSLLVLPLAPPVAVLELISPSVAAQYPLGTTFRISWALSTGGDGVNDLQPKMTLNKDGAPQSVATLGPCFDDGASSQEPNSQVECFSADTEGTFAVQLTVSNGTTSAPVTLTFVVLGDQLPCIGDTQPPLTATVVSAAASTGMTFTVNSIEDDLDSIPPKTSDDPAVKGLFGRPHFHWSVKHGNSVFEPRPNDSNVVVIDPEEFQIGETGQVRLEISDDNTAVSGAQFLACSEDTCFTGMPSDGCFQRVTWTVNFNQ